MNLEYAIRSALFGLMLLGFGAWSLYDGIWGYPKHNRRVDAYQALIQEAEQGRQTRQEWHAAWLKLAEDNGWSADKPKARHGTRDIRTQFIMALIFCPIGIASLIAVALNSRRRFSAEDDGLHGFAATAIPYTAITAIDKKKWDRKGIAKLEVSIEGAARKITLDDWKFRGIAAILAEIEKRRPELVPAPPPAPAPAAPAGDSGQPPSSTV
jgi:hypothetical protein